jgi:hypothetical protein
MIFSAVITNGSKTGRPDVLGRTAYFVNKKMQTDVLLEQLVKPLTVEKNKYFPSIWPTFVNFCKPDLLALWQLFVSSTSPW